MIIHGHVYTNSMRAIVDAVALAGLLQFRDAEISALSVGIARPRSSHSFSTMR